MDNVVDFAREQQKRSPRAIEPNAGTAHILEVEHELLETQMQVWALHRDLERMRRAHQKTRRELADSRRALRSGPVCL